MNTSYQHIFKQAVGLILSFGLFAQAEAQTHLQGLLMLEREQPQKAHQLFNTLIASEPQQSEGYFYKGIAYLQQKQLDSAGLFFQKAAGVDQKSALAQVGLGYWHQESGKAAAAAGAYEKALEYSKSKDPQVLRWLVEAKLQQEKPNAAELMPLLEKAKKHAPDDPALHVLTGDVHLLNNEGGPAVSSYEKAFSLDMQKAGAQLKIGKLYMRTKNYPVAQQHLQQAIAADPEYTTAYRELGEVAYLTQQFKEASNHYQKYLSLTENKHTARMRGGYFTYLAKDWSTAIQLFEQVLSQEPDALLILKYYAYALLEAEQLPKAADAFERYFKLATPEQQDVQDFEHYARLLVKQQKDTLAIRQYERVLVKSPQDPEALQALGDLYFKQKEYKPSAAAYSQLAQGRKQPMAQDYFVLGRSHYYAGQYQQADTAFNKLLELQPDLLAASLWKARTQSNLDPDSEQGLAKPFYEKVVEKGTADAAKYKNELKEAYTYLGYYYYLKNEIEASKKNWQAVKALDPQDAKAINALKALNP